MFFAVRVTQMELPFVLLLLAAKACYFYKVKRMLTDRSRGYKVFTRRASIRFLFSHLMQALLKVFGTSGSLGM